MQANNGVIRVIDENMPRLDFQPGLDHVNVDNTTRPISCKVVNIYKYSSKHTF